MTSGFQDCRQSGGDPGRMGVAMFCAGFYGMLAQVLLLREMLVAFYGNELTIGVMLGAWLALIGAGSLAARPALRRIARPRLAWLLPLLLLGLAAILPVQVWLIRIIRAILRVPFGAYASCASMSAGIVCVLLPTGLGLGAVFPCACRLASGARDEAASPEEGGALGRLYSLDSFGSLIGGALFAFLFVQLLTPFSIAALASGAAVCGAAFAAPRPAARRSLALLLAALALVFAGSDLPGAMESSSVKERWRAFGCLPERRAGASPDDGCVRLLADFDTRYQNIALIESHGQMTLYGNGQVLGVFPDSVAGEHKIHFIMGQYPAAKSALLVGGNPVTDIPELLKYPLRRLVRVELDGAVGPLLERAGGREYMRALRDPRLVQAVADGPRFVKTARERFDVVIVDAPDPTTIALNRFYTLDFYRAVRKILAPGGFLHVSVESSELLKGDALPLTASVYRTLREVFPVVLAGAGARNSYFAGVDDARLSLNRKTLYERSAGAGLRHRFFRPEYFLNADELSPDKIEYVARRLGELHVPVNTALRPVSAFYQLRMWLRFSGSDALLSPLFSGRAPGRWRWAGVAFAAACVIFLLGRLARRARRRRPPAAAGAGRARALLGAVLVSTGFGAMALEVILIYLFQSLLGYVYAQIGLIVSVFMLGMMAGAACAARRAAVLRSWAWIIGADGLLLVLAAATPFLAEACLRIVWLAGSETRVESLINGFVFLTGWAAGAQFVAVNNVLRRTGLTLGISAAQSHAADHFGAAVGSLLAGVVLLPVWGLRVACVLLAAIKGGSLLAAWAARRAGDFPPSAPPGR